MFMVESSDGFNVEMGKEVFGRCGFRYRIGGEVEREEKGE